MSGLQEFVLGFVWMAGWYMLIDGMQRRFGWPVTLMFVGVASIVLSTLAMNGLVMFR